MKLTWSLTCCLVLLCCFAGALSQSLKWEDCGPEDRVVKFLALAFGPEPITFNKVNKFDMTLHMKLEQDITEEDLVEIKIVRLQAFGRRTIRFPMPCLDGVLGSCSLKFCDYFKDPRIFPAICSVFKAGGQACECPLKKGDYDATDMVVNVDLTKLKIPAFLASLGSGTYEIQVTLTNKDKKKLGCYKVTSPIRINLRN